MNRIVITLFLLSVFLINFLPVKDTDFGWHYRCGKELCLKNNFSYFLSDYKAAYPSFIYDKVLALTYDFSGFTGVGFLGAAIMTLAAFIFIKLTKNHLYLSMIFYYISLFFSWQVLDLGLRPQILTYLFFLFSLFIISKSGTNPKWLWLFPLLMFIWVNTHIGFFVGLAVLGFYVAGNGFEPFSIIILMLSSIVTLVNPFGINIYHEILNHATTLLNTMIAEWVAPPLWQQILIVLLSAVYFFVMVKKKSFRIFEMSMIFFFGYLALTGIRNSPFFYALILYLISEYLPHYQEKNSFLSIPLLSALILFLFIINVPKAIGFDTSWNIYCHDGTWNFPCEAIVKYPQLSGNVYAAYEWGGFLIWKKPEIKVFVDGRMPAWKDENGKSPYQDYLYIIQTRPGWNGILRKLKTDYLFIAPGTFLDLLLQKDAQKYGWEEKYRDDVAVIYKAI